jgi:hypothetical protein
MRVEERADPAPCVLLRELVVDPDELQHPVQRVVVVV